ncbi:GNAT family N-acetyltransferase [Erythrobacter sp. CCH5-A1]|jgi:GNAT superfamily N-acetyltransferase|uniref:GNAT family N-acetyltransferase n=1 Tax=Erythrobacter sp. CCH5-A1 TaxID=1768792 RepID=UPI000832E990|nr:GNAT family N-acetyltransferase [Erythrobacter sp. CCH5-A1]
MQATVRIATHDDLPAIAAIVERAIADLQHGFLSAREIEASRQFMGVDSQLLRDGTYLCAVLEGEIAGCGGWSWRRTLFGGDGAGDLIDPEPLDPMTEPARIRAMYTHPGFVRRGVGMAILSAAEDAARAAGFRDIELMSTLSGEPLYRRCGYTPSGPEARYADVPLIPMRKSLLG